MATSATLADEKPTCPEHLRDRPIIRKKIWERMHLKDKNYMSIICGETGSGKSEFGLRLCELVDPNFSEDQIAFTIERFMELVNADYPTGSAILFDEVGIALSHAKHYEEEVIRVNHILQSWRDQNRMLVMTSPHINLVAKADRGLLHAQMDMQNIDREMFMSTVRYRNIQQNNDSGDLYKKYPRLRDPQTGRTSKFRHLTLYKPSTEISKPYLEKKATFNDELNEKVLEQVREKNEEQRDVNDIAEEILEEGLAGYVKKHPINGHVSVSKDLILADYGMGHHSAGVVKSIIEREVDDLEHYV